MNPKIVAPVLSAIIASVLGAASATAKSEYQASSSIAMEALTGSNATVSANLELKPISSDDAEIRQFGHSSHSSHSSHRSHYSSR